MSRTRKKHHPYWYSKQEYVEYIHKWYDPKDYKREIGMFGTEAKNWRVLNTKLLKRHSRRERRAYERVEIQKSYRDWDYEFDNKIEPWLKRLIWAYD